MGDTSANMEGNEAEQLEIYSTLPHALNLKSAFSSHHLLKEQLFVPLVLLSFTTSFKRCLTFDAYSAQKKQREFFNLCLGTFNLALESPFWRKSNTETQPKFQRLSKTAVTSLNPHMVTS